MTYIGNLMKSLGTVRDILLTINSKDHNDVENKINQCLELIKKLNV